MWNAHRQRFQRVEVNRLLAPGNGDWAQAIAPNTALSDQAGALRASRPESGAPPEGKLVRPVRRSQPSGIGAAVSGGMVRLWWSQPTWFDDGTPTPSGLNLLFRIFRDGEPVKDVHALEYNEAVTVRAKPYKYQVSAVIEDPLGERLASIRSQPIRVAVPAIVARGL